MLNQARHKIRAAGYRNGIARQLLVYIIIFSFFITLVSTALQVYIDFKRDINGVGAKFDEIQASYIQTIGVSLWNVDTEQLQAQMEGILVVPDVSRVELREIGEGISTPLHLVLGDEPSKQSIVREFSIPYQRAPGDARVLGVLTIEISIDAIYKRQAERVTVILLAQFVKTFLVSAFILFVFYRLVTRHLVKIANTLESVDLHNPALTLQLNRSRRSGDELDDLVRAFNTMSASLKSAYAEVTQANQQLERDIIARKEAEQEVVRLNNKLEHRVLVRTSELEAANKELSAFTFSVSHDLRAPVRRIQAFQSVLLEHLGEQADDKAKHYLRRIEVCADQMSEMIDSFLRLSRATQAQLILEDMSLSELAYDIVERLREKEPNRRVAVSIQEGMRVEADRRLVDVLLTNLLENAWKYSKNTRAASIEFAQKQSHGKLAYCVTDNGAGFDMKEATDLLKPFTRLHVSKDYEGAGIGLATVNRIVTRHGGKLWFDAKVDQGAAFYFTFWEVKDI